MAYFDDTFDVDQAKKEFLAWLGGKSRHCTGQDVWNFAERHNYVPDTFREEVILPLWKKREVLCFTEPASKTPVCIDGINCFAGKECWYMSADYKSRIALSDFPQKMKETYPRYYL